MMITQQKRHAAATPKIWLATALSGLILGNLLLPALLLFTTTPTATAVETSATGTYKGQISIVKEVTMAPQSAKVDLAQRDFPLKDLLHILAKQGGFNVIVDPAIDSTVTFDVKNVTINKMLEYLIRTYDLSYTQDGNTMIITTRDTANDRQLNVKAFKAIPVKYRDASSTATLLNSILFPGRAGTTQNAIASADAESNALLVMGTDSDIKAVEEALKQFDIPRHRAVIKVMHSSPTYIMQAIQSELFPAGFGGAAGGGGGGAAGGGGGGAAGGGGGGAAGGGGGAAGGGGGGGGAAGGGGGGGGAAGGGGGGAAGGGGGGAAGGGATTGGSSVVGGVSFSMVANTLTNTVIVQGTPEQIERAKEIAKDVDVRPAQVKIEVSLIEISNTKTKVFAPSFGTLQIGEFGINILGGGSNINSNSKQSINSQGFTSNLGSNNFRLPTVGINFRDNTVSGKLLANPNIIALDNTTSTVNITDSIVYFQTTVTNSGGTVTRQTQPQTQQVGIKLSITPHITNDGAVTLSLTPSVTQLLGIVTEPVSGTSAPQTSQRDFSLSSVRVRDGETLMIGGLIKDFASKDITKIPGLADLPIVGALFRATSTDPGNVYTRSELIVMVTPHILKEDGLSYYGYGAEGTNKDKPAYVPKKPNDTQAGVVSPTPLPKFSADELPALPKDADIQLGKFTFPAKQEAGLSTTKKTATTTHATKSSTHRGITPVSSNTLPSPRKSTVASTSSNAYNMLNYTNNAENTDIFNNSTGRSNLNKGYTGSPNNSTPYDTTSQPY
jgi:type II secretory pathway component GspD/PulD (secretin)